MNGVLKIFVVLSCVCTSIGASRLTVYGKINRPRGAHQLFQIHSSGYDKCLASVGFFQPFLVLEDCNSRKTQLWYFTPEGQLVSYSNSRCLAAYSVSLSFLGLTKYVAAMKLCNSKDAFQIWQCDRGFLKLRDFHQYLVPFVFRGVGGVGIRSTVTNSCLWSRYGTSNSLCQNGTSKYAFCNDSSDPIKSDNDLLRAVTTESRQWFQIQNVQLSKCLALRDMSTYSGVYSFPPLLTLKDCDRNSDRQAWQWTSNDQLRLKYNGQCLTTNEFNGMRFEPCTVSPVRHQWICRKTANVKTHLILKSTLRSLQAYPYSGLPFGYNVLTRWWCNFGYCGWTRFGSQLSICDKGETLTTPLIATQTTSTPSTVRPTDNLPTPPLPLTGDLKTPPLPFTGDLKTPPLPGNTPPVLPDTPKLPPPFGNEKIRCGTKGRVGGVVNGTAAAAGSWPWQVGIKTYADTNITCGGTLINDEWVVTAAHCVSGWFPDELHVVIGEVDQSKKSGHEQEFKCSEIILHEEYGRDAPYDKDIALLRLDNYALFNDHVRPLCLPKKETALSDKDLCTVTGFGKYSEHGLKTAQLLQANVRVVPLKTCAKSYAELLNPRKVTSNMLCAGYKKGGTDACAGDSGGPLTCFDRSNSRFVLGGVVSWGVGCARPNLYGVYTNAAVFTSWVQEKLASYGY